MSRALQFPGKCFGVFNVLQLRILTNNFKIFKIQKEEIHTVLNIVATIFIVVLRILMYVEFTYQQMDFFILKTL